MIFHFLLATAAGLRCAGTAERLTSLADIMQVVPIWKKEFFEDGQVWKENVKDSTRGSERVV